MGDNKLRGRVKKSVKKKDKQSAKSVESKSSSVGRYRGALNLIVFAVVLHILVRTFIFEIFHVPTGSMLPNILVGDHIFVTKYSYGYGPHSSIFSLPLTGRILFSEPKRGDIIVFKGDNHMYVKRLIGLPGDKVEMVRGRVRVNDEFLPREAMDDVYIDMNRVAESLYTWNKFKESCDDKEYVTISSQTARLRDFPNTTHSYIVPKEHYFFLGDNRDYSSDSRFPGSIGFVHQDNLSGKARFILYNTRFIGNMNKSMRLFRRLK